MSYKPIEYVPQTATRCYIEPAPEPMQDEPYAFGYWTTIALKVCGVVAGLTSGAMLYLVFICAIGGR